MEFKDSGAASGAAKVAGRMARMAEREIRDAESAQIMAGFYDNVARGSPPSQALREAQLAFIKQRRADRNYESATPTTGPPPA